MKSWKEIPNLFANGKFEIRNKEGDEISYVDYLCSQRQKQCTLIARPISDMSDDEVVNFFNAESYRDDVDIPQLRKDIEFLIEDGISFERALNLLSIGVYPFDQDNPKDVIWRYENDESNK